VCPGVLRDFMEAKKLTVAHAPYEDISFHNLNEALMVLKIPKWKD
jgi:hypothetical protein